MRIYLINFLVASLLRVSAKDLCVALTTSSNVTRGEVYVINKTIYIIDKVIIINAFSIQGRQSVEKIRYHSHKIAEMQWRR